MKLYMERCGEGSAERTCERKMGVGEREKWKVWTSGKVMEAGEKEKWKGDGMEEWWNGRVMEVGDEEKWKWRRTNGKGLIRVQHVVQGSVEWSDHW